MSEIALPNGTTWVEAGERFLVEGGQVMRVVGAVTAAAESPVVLLGAAAVLVASSPSVPVSREYAEGVIAREHAAAADAAAHPGIPHASPSTPSPFSQPGVLASLPTAAMLAAGITSTLHPPGVAIDATTAPHLVPVPMPTTIAMPGQGTVLEAARVEVAASISGTAVMPRIDNCKDGFKAFNSFDALKTYMNSPSGWEVHHIVEQTLGTPEFGTRVIQNTSNAIALPEDVHKIISKEYSSKWLDVTTDPPTPYSHFRDYVSKQSFDRQREIGFGVARDAVSQALKEGKITPELADQLKKQLNKIDVPDLCNTRPPTPQLPNLPDLNDINNAVQHHNQQSNARLPDASSVAKWDGSTRSGTFLDIGNGQVAQHQGQGAYAVADVQQQLGGQMPPIGQYATLQQNGQVQVPQQSHSLGMQLG